MTAAELQAIVTRLTEAGLLEVCDDDGCAGGQREELFDETARKVFAHFTEQLMNGEPMSFNPWVYGHRSTLAAAPAMHTSRRIRS